MGRYNDNENDNDDDAIETKTTCWSEERFQLKGQQQVEILKPSLNLTITSSSRWLFFTQCIKFEWQT